MAPFFDVIGLPPGGCRKNNDYYDTSVTAALQAIDELIEERYTFVTVEQILTDCRKSSVKPAFLCYDVNNNTESKE